jgi:hypothetical protein
MRPIVDVILVHGASSTRGSVSDFAAHSEGTCSPGGRDAEAAARALVVPLALKLISDPCLGAMNTQRGMDIDGTVLKM